MQSFNRASMFTAPQHASYPSICADLPDIAEQPAPPLPAQVFSICYPAAVAVRTLELRELNTGLLKATAATTQGWIAAAAQSDLDRLCAVLLEHFCAEDLTRAIEWTAAETANVDAIDAPTLTAVLATAVLTDVGRFLREPLLFELNLALKAGLVEGGDLQTVAANGAALLRDAEYREYLSVKYPLIAQRAARRIGLVVTSLQRLLGRLRRDLPEICGMLSMTASGVRVTDIRRGAGDSHHGADGVAVVMLTGARRVVYKPRSMACEAAYNGFIEWLNEAQREADLRLLSVPCIARDDYGWMAHVEHLPVDGEAATRRYFRRYGALAAVLDLLNATDIHFENLIACGEHPVVIDLETILQPTRIASSANDGKPIGIMDLEFFTGGVYFTGMFDPIFLRGSLDGSPLAGRRTWLEKSDDLAFDAKSRQLALAKGRREVADAHCVFYEGRILSGYAHGDAILAGFQSTYDLLLRHKRALLEDVLDRYFGNVPVRVIFRETARYAELLRARDSTYCLESVEKSDEFLLKLMNAHEEKVALRSLFPAEYEACLDGDVPYFYAGCRDRHVMSAAGEVPGLRLEMSGMQETRQRLLRANRGYVDRAAGCIAYSLSMKQAERDGTTPSVGNAEELGIPADAGAIIDIVRQRVVVRAGNLHAVDLVLGNDMATKHRTLGDDVYLGLPGVVLAGALHDRLTNGELGAETAALAERVFDRLHAGESARVGACVGLGGYAYLALRLGALGNDALMLEVAQDLLAQATGLSYMDRHFDVFSGLAGTVLVAAAVVKHGGAETSRLHLRSLAATLLGHAERSGDALVWKSSIPSQGPITGFGHGASGIGCALVRAYVHTGEDRFLNGAVGVHRLLERGRSDDHGWRDALNGADKSLHAWCHGAPGIGLFYRDLCAVLPRDEYLSRLDLAVTHTLTALDYENDSLCHGSLGNADLLLELPAALGRAAEVEAALRAMEERLAARPLRCGNVLKHQSLALFTGVTGMAYQLMRLNAPNRVPSVLTFDVERRTDD